MSVVCQTNSVLYSKELSFFANLANMYKCTYFSQQPNCNVRVEFLIDAVHEQFRRSMRFHVSLTPWRHSQWIGFQRALGWAWLDIEFWNNSSLEILLRRRSIDMAYCVWSFCVTFKSRCYEQMTPTVSCNLNFELCNIIGESRGEEGPCPSQSNFFHFHAVFGKCLAK